MAAKKKSASLKMNPESSERKAFTSSKETLNQKKSRWITQAVEVISQFEGNHGYANITDNFDGQGMSCGVMNWNLGQGTLCGLFPDSLINKYMDDSAEMFRLMTRKNQSQIDRVELAKKMQLDKKQWMNFCDDLTVLLESSEGIKIQNDVIEKTIARFAFDNLPKDYPSFRAFLFMMDIRVQNGSLKGLKYGDLSPDIVQQPQGLNKGQLLLMHLAHLRANKCNPQWRQNVLHRKIYIATGDRPSEFKNEIKIPSPTLMEEKWL